MNLLTWDTFNDTDRLYGRMGGTLFFTIDPLGTGYGVSSTLFNAPQSTEQTLDAAKTYAELQLRRALLYINNGLTEATEGEYYIKVPE